MQKRLSIFLIIIVISSSIYCQNSIYPKKLDVFFEFYGGKIIDTSGLKLKIFYHNKGIDTALVFSELIDGNFRDPIGNIYCEIQVLKNGKYFSYNDFPRDYFFSDSFPPPERVYVKLPPQASLTSNFNLISKAIFFTKGKYRVKFYLFFLPIDISKQYTLKYRKSRWFYFEVLKNLRGS